MARKSSMPVSFLNAEDRGMICYKNAGKRKKGIDRSWKIY